MKAYRVSFSRAALAHLDEVFAFVAGRDGVDRADAYVSELREKCHQLGAIPVRGTARDDLKAGLRTAGLGKRANVAFVVDHAAKSVVIHGVFTGGRDIDKYFKRH